METNIIKIGNSKGIILSSAIIKATGIKDSVKIEVKNNSIIIRAIKNPREGWEEAAKKMHENGDDRLLIPDMLEDEDLSGWSW